MLAKIVLLVIIAISIFFLISGYSNSDKMFTLIGVLLLIAAYLVKSMMKIKLFYK